MQVKIFIAILFFSYIRQPSFSQVWPGPHPLLSPWIKITGEEHPASDVVNNLKYGFHRAEGIVNIPVYRGKDWLTATGTQPLLAATVHLGASMLMPSGKFIENDVQLLRLRMGGNIYYETGIRNLFMLNVQGVMAHDANSFPLSGIYLNGSAQWRHRSNDQFGYTLGIAYTSLFSKNLLLPVLGFHYRPLKEDLFTLMLPYHLQYTHFFSRALSVSATLKESGGFYRVDNLITDTMNFESVRFRNSGLFASARINYKISYQLTVEPEAGWAFNRKLYIDDVSFNHDAAPYARITERYKFGKRANVAPILDFDPGDLSTGETEVPEN